MLMCSKLKFDGFFMSKTQLRGPTTRLWADKSVIPTRALQTFSLVGPEDCKRFHWLPLTLLYFLLRVGGALCFACVWTRSDLGRVHEQTDQTVARTSEPHFNIFPHDLIFLKIYIHSRNPPSRLTDFDFYYINLTMFITHLCVFTQYFKIILRDTKIIRFNLLKIVSEIFNT